MALPASRTWATSAVTACPLPLRTARSVHPGAGKPRHSPLRPSPVRHGACIDAGLSSLVADFPGTLLKYLQDTGEISCILVILLTGSAAEGGTHEQTSFDDNGAYRLRCIQYGRCRRTARQGSAVCASAGDRMDRLLCWRPSRGALGGRIAPVSKIRAKPAYSRHSCRAGSFFHSTSGRKE